MNWALFAVIIHNYASFYCFQFTLSLILLICSHSNSPLGHPRAAVALGLNVPPTCAHRSASTRLERSNSHFGKQAFGPIVWRNACKRTGRFKCFELTKCCGAQTSQITLCTAKVFRATTPPTPGSYTALVVTRWWFLLCLFQSKRLQTATKTAERTQLRTRTCPEPQRHRVYFSASTVAVGDSKPWCSKSRDIHRASWLEHWLLDIFSQLPHSQELSKQREAGHFTCAEVTSLHLRRSHLML